MKQALKTLIGDLIKLEEKYEELTDTAVREAMGTAVHNSFIVPKSGYVLPDDFEMFSKAGNKQIKSVIQKFLEHPDVIAAKKELKTPQQRLDAFQDITVDVDGYTYDEFFGYAESV